jgi:hypothetical protein
MRKLVLSAVLLITCLSLQAQDNPYQIFGYKPKVEFKEEKRDFLIIPNQIHLAL